MQRIEDILRKVVVQKVEHDNVHKKMKYYYSKFILMLHLNRI